VIRFLIIFFKEPKIRWDYHLALSSVSDSLHKVLKVEIRKEIIFALEKK
jgi:hypothetical protein